MNKSKKGTMNANNKNEKPKVIGFENIPTQDHSFVYADNTQISLNLFDIKVMFGVSQGKNPDGRVRVLNHTTIAMSPQHAKSVMLLLQQTIERYENDFMSLPLKEERADFKED
jgi:hypothetical protein